MPIYTYRNEYGCEIDEYFATWRDAPSELIVDHFAGTFRKVPARFVSRFPDPSAKAEERQGIVPFESGMDRDAARARQYRQEKEDRERRKALEAAMADV